MSRRGKHCSSDELVCSVFCIAEEAEAAAIRMIRSRSHISKQEKGRGVWMIRDLFLGIHHHTLGFSIGR